MLCCAVGYGECESIRRCCRQSMQEGEKCDDDENKMSLLGYKMLHFGSVASCELIQRRYGTKIEVLPPVENPWSAERLT
jgi:hypothetical protein